MPPSKRALQQLRNMARSRHISMTTFAEFCDRAGDAVLLQIVSSCDDPGDMFAIIVGIKRFAVCANRTFAIIQDFGSGDALVNARGFCWEKK